MNAPPSTESRLSLNRRLLSIAEFSREYGICRSRVYNELNSGRLAGLKAGRITLISRDEAEKWMATLPRYGSTQKLGLAITMELQEVQKPDLSQMGQKDIRND